MTLCGEAANYCDINEVLDIGRQARVQAMHWVN